MNWVGIDVSKDRPDVHVSPGGEARSVGRSDLDAAIGETVQASPPWHEQLSNC